MTAVRLTEQDVFALHDSTTPYYWYSIDPIRTGLTSVIKNLREETEKKTRPGNVVQSECETHITIYYRTTLGPDKDYEDVFYRDPKYPFTVLYWDEQGNAGAAVKEMKGSDRWL